MWWMEPGGRLEELFIFNSVIIKTIMIKKCLTTELTIAQPTQLWKRYYHTSKISLSWDCSSFLFFLNLHPDKGNIACGCSRKSKGTFFPLLEKKNTPYSDFHAGGNLACSFWRFTEPLRQSGHVGRSLFAFLWCTDNSWSLARKTILS